MSKSVRTLLKEHGPGMTSELINFMVESNGLLPATARQRVARAKGEIKRLAGLRFTKNARFIYLEDQYDTPKFWKAIERAFQSSGASYWGAVVGLRARGGSCPKFLFPSVCGAPLARKSHLSPDRILERLKAIHLLEETSSQETDDPFIRFRPGFYDKKPDAVIKATLVAEEVALLALHDWARKIGFGSYDKFKIRDSTSQPVVSGIVWDMSAPSYMRPLASLQEGTIKPGFVVFDVNLHSPVSEEAVALFVRKHKLASAPVNVAPIMPFLIGEVFTQGAFDLARKSGVAVTTPNTLFGEEIAKGLRDLIKLLSNTGATAAVNPDHLCYVMNALTKIEGAANNLRGALFELAVGSLAKDIEGGYLQVGRKGDDPYSGRSVEIDVLLDRPEGKSVLIIECKSKIPGTSVSQEEIKRWYEDRVPLIYKILAQDARYRDRSFRFELWSNGPIDPRALERMEIQNTGSEGFSVGWKDGAVLKEYAKKAESSAIRKMLNEHYFRHPLAGLKNSTPV